jgi:uncharacterized membrane protein
MLVALAAAIPLLTAQAASAPATNSAATIADGPLLGNPAGILAVLLAVLASVFWLTQHPVFGRIFKIIPALVFCYFVPTTLTTLGVIPDVSPLYEWVKTFVLPASLLLLILALDVPGILRLGPKAVIMLLAGTTGVVIGGPISLFICQRWLPEDAWRGMTALAGSWIGGGANFVALGEAARVSPEMLGAMVIPDVFVASIWMGVLLYLSGHQHRIDAWSGANPEAIRELERRMTAFQERVTRAPKLADLIIILMFGFLGSWLSYSAGVQINGALERRLTVGAVKLTADRRAGAAAEAKLAIEEVDGRKERLLTLSIVSDEPTVGSTADGASPASDIRAISVHEATVNLSSAGVETLGELVGHINERIPEWSAELLPVAGAAERPATELRRFGRSSVSAGGHVMRLPDHRRPGLWNLHTSLAASTWKFIIVTAVGVVLSFTRARNLEGAGASKLGAVMIYLLVTCIGASADFAKIVEAPALIVMGFVWIAFHIIMLLGVGWLIKAPIFFVAVGSQSNIGGAASAPVVAAAYHPSLAPVGALLAVAGYVLGTYAGLICMQMLKAVAQAGG